MSGIQVEGHRPQRRLAAVSHHCTRSAAGVLFTLQLCAVLLAAMAPAGRAQELEPRAYSPSPVGANFALVAYGRSTGQVVTDPALPISDVSAHINGLSFGLGRTFGVGGRQGLVTAALPYSWGDAEGNVEEEHRQITRSGLADLRAKVSVNLFGSPALSPPEFAKRPRERFILGTSLTVAVPIGQYEPSRLINLGTNRWAFKPEVGLSVPWRRFYFDVYAGAWFFTENNDYYPGGSTRHQDPLTNVQAHVSYSIRPRLWLALDGTWYGGGDTQVDDGVPSGRLSNSRLGATLSAPIIPGHSVKVAYSTGASVRSGSDFESLGIAWQFQWF